MPIYTLYLSTFSTSPTSNQGVPTNKTNLNNVTWSINWDDVFRMENSKFNRCRLRLKLTTTTWTAGANDWIDYLGYLTCNLASRTGGFATYGTPIAQVTAMDAPTTGTTTHVIMIDTTNEPGIDVEVPYGNRDFTLSFNDNDLSQGTRMAGIQDYQVFLYFELYEPK